MHLAARRIDKHGCSVLFRKFIKSLSDYSMTAKDADM